MRAFRISIVCLSLAMAATVLLAPSSADAACRWFKATHNGTDFFYSDGAAGTAEFKVKSMIDQWKSAKGIKHGKIHMAKTSCGDWFVKYMLPHKHCVAKARICY